MKERQREAEREEGGRGRGRGGTSRSTNLSSVRKSLNSKTVDKKRTFILFSTFTIHSLFPRVAARWRGEDFFPPPYAAAGI